MGFVGQAEFLLNAEFDQRGIAFRAILSTIFTDMSAEIAGLHGATSYPARLSLTEPV